MKHSLLLALIVLCGCNGALRNPQPVKQPAAWNVEREKSERAQLPTAQARTTEPEPQPAAPIASPAPVVATPTAQVVTPPPSTASNTSLPVIATVGDSKIDIGDLLSLWMHRDSFELFKQANHLVANRLVELESQRLGLVADETLVEQRYKEGVADMEQEIGKKRPGVRLDDYIDRVLGLDPLRYRARLRADTARGWLAERCVRAFLLQTEHTEMRLIAVQDEDKLKAVQAELASGADFAEVAKKHSVDPSSKLGGRIAPVVKSGSIMGRLAFQTALGTVSAPQYEQGVWLLVKAEARPQPISGNWKEIGSAVEASLQARAIDDVEYKQWETAMAGRYRIDLAPLLKLSGQASR